MIFINIYYPEILNSYFGGDYYVQKINDYIIILSLLHQKTSYLREINLDEIKSKYEELNDEIISLKKYYYDLNDLIDKEMFLSPSMYLLVRNISLIYSLLDNSRLLLHELYEKMRESKSIRVSLLHHNIDIDHLIVNDSKYLISWDKSYFGSPINDLVEFYRKYYNDILLNDFLKIYEQSNKLSWEEKMLLIIILAIPKKIELTRDTYLDTKIINKEINYLNKIYEMVIKMKKK